MLVCVCVLFFSNFVQVLCIYESFFRNHRSSFMRIYLTQDQLLYDYVTFLYNFFWGIIKHGVKIHPILSEQTTIEENIPWWSEQKWIKKKLNIFERINWSRSNSILNNNNIFSSLKTWIMIYTKTKKNEEKVLEIILKKICYLRKRTYSGLMMKNDVKGNLYFWFDEFFHDQKKITILFIYCKLKQKSKLDFWIE